MNVLMESCTVTYRNGQTARLENVFIRGSKIRFLILPDMLKNAPMFKNMTGRTEGRGGGGGNFGKSAILRAQARGGGRGGRGRGGGHGWGGPPMRR